MAMVKKGLAHAVAHITGSGFEGNIPRVIPDHLRVEIRRSAWRVPEIFREIQRRGKVPEKEMFDTFNMGIGMIVVTSPRAAGTARRILSSHGIKSVLLGSVKTGGPGVTFVP
jgi:phosphoribosylformylglycinamidine cyclo-ligase